MPPRFVRFEELKTLLVRDRNIETALAVKGVRTISVKAGAMESMPNPRAPNVRNAT